MWLRLNVKCYEEASIQFKVLRQEYRLRGFTKAEVIPSPAPFLEATLLLPLGYPANADFCLMLLVEVKCDPAFRSLLKCALFCWLVFSACGQPRHELWLSRNTNPVPACSNGWWFHAAHRQKGTAFSKCTVTSETTYKSEGVGHVFTELVAKHETAGALWVLRPPNIVVGYVYHLAQGPAQWDTPVAVGKMRNPRQQRDQNKSEISAISKAFAISSRINQWLC